MRLQFALLAVAAAGPPDGLLYIHGGGINTFWVQQFPSAFQGTLVLRLHVDRSEAGRPHIVEIQVTDADGHSILPQAVSFPVVPQLPPQWPRGWPIPIQIVANLTGLQLAKAGEYGISVLIGGQHAGGEQFQIIEGLPPGAQALPQAR